MARDPDSPPGGYEVGYKKPPKRTRFKMRNRANPNGRRGKKEKAPTERCLADVIQEVLDAKYLVTVNGRRRRLTGRQCLGQRLMAAVLQGDFKAMKVLIEEDGRRRTAVNDNSGGAEAEGAAPPTEADEAIIERYFARSAGAHPRAGSHDGEEDAA